MPRWNVTIQQRGSRWAEVKIEADTAEEAESLAVHEIWDLDFGDFDVEEYYYEAVEIEEEPKDEHELHDAILAWSKAHPEAKEVNFNRALLWYRKQKDV